MEHARQSRSSRLPEASAAGADWKQETGRRHERAARQFHRALQNARAARPFQDSAPYFHNGLTDKKEDAILFYIGVSSMGRAGTLRNADPELLKIDLKPEDVAPLAAFLLALDEDYPD